MATGVTLKPKFQIQMKAAGLAPETVRASDLAALLIHLEAAITETARSQNIPFAFEANEVLVSLVDVAEGNSSDLTIAVAHPITRAVSVLTQAVYKRDFTALPFEAQNHLHELSQHAIRRRWSYEFHPSNGLAVAPAVISYEFPVPKPTEIETTSGSSTIWGHLIKIGGDAPGAVLRLRDGKLLSVKVSRSMVLEMDDRNLVYKDIGLRGTATWKLEDWSIQSFKAESIVGYRSEDLDLADAFRDLSKASQGRWNGIDPVKFVDELRSEDP